MSLKEKELDTNLKIAILNFLSKTQPTVRCVLKTETNEEPVFERIYKYIKSVS